MLSLTIGLLLSIVGHISATAITTCSDTCFTESFALTDCSLKDSYCVCTSQVFADKFVTCVEGSCPAGNVESLLQQADDFCSTVGHVEKRDADPKWNNRPSYWRNGPGKPGSSSHRPAPGSSYNWSPPWRPSPGNGNKPPKNNPAPWNPPKPGHPKPNPTHPDKPHQPWWPHPPANTVWQDS